MCRHMWITNFDECTCNVPDSAWMGEHTMRSVVFFPLFLSLLARYHAIYSTVWLFWAFACVMKLPFVTTYCGFQASPTFFYLSARNHFQCVLKNMEKKTMRFSLSYRIFFHSELKWVRKEFTNLNQNFLISVYRKRIRSLHWNFITL